MASAEPLCRLPPRSGVSRSSRSPSIPSRRCRGAAGAGRNLLQGLLRPGMRRSPQGWIPACGNPGMWHRAGRGWRVLLSPRGFGSPGRASGKEPGSFRIAGNSGNDPGTDGGERGLRSSGTSPVAPRRLRSHRTLGTSLAAASWPAGSVQSRVPSLSPRFIPRERRGLAGCQREPPGCAAGGLRGWRGSLCQRGLWGAARSRGTASPCPLGWQLPSCSGAARCHPQLRLGFGGRRLRHPLGEHDLGQGERAARRGCQRQRLLGREFRQIRGQAAAGFAWGGTTGRHKLLGSPPPTRRCLRARRSSRREFGQGREGSAPS